MNVFNSKKTMNANNLSPAVVYNNEGIICLRMGEYNTAISLLSKSLNLVKQVLGQDATNAGEVNCCNCICECNGRGEGPSYVFVDVSFSKEELVNNTKLLLSSSTDTAAYENQMSIGSHYLFQKAIYIKMDNGGCNKGNFISHAFVLINNLALAHHLCAWYNPTSSASEVNELYMKALSLYELAYTIQESGEHRIHSCLLHSMAILNNVGHIHAVLKNFKQSAEILQQLLNTIMYCMTYRIDFDMDWNEVDGFVRNVMPLLLPATGTFAPAAAA